MSKPMTVYQCPDCPEESACGLDERSFDCAYDECHHPLDREYAEEIARRWNAYEELVAALEDTLNYLGGWNEIAIVQRVHAALAKAKA